MIDTAKIPKPTVDYRNGFSDGWSSRHEAAYRRGVSEENARWSMALGIGTSTFVMPRARELADRRRVSHEPCRTRCGRCSACFHAEAWARRGNRDYLGADSERTEERAA